MKIFLAQQNYHIGNFEQNTAKILEAIHTAKAAGGALIVFSELSVCGYPPRDFLEFNDFIEQCLTALEQVRLASEDIGVIVGAPARNPVAEGKDLFNAGYFFYNKECVGIAHKTLLPTYDIFDEYRYFEPAFEWNVIDFKGIKIALTVCEDIWNLGDNPLYRICPMDELMKQSPDIMINISASPFDYTHAEGRQAIVKANVEKYGLPMVYCNAVGSQTEIVFDGGSMVVDKDFRLLKQLPFFEEALDFVELPSLQQKSLPSLAQLQYDDSLPVNFDAQKGMAQIHQALVIGIKDYFSKMGFRKAIVASSGGVDSALTLALACEALGAEHVRALLMPSQYSSGHSVKDAEQLSKNLNNPYEIIPIKEVFDAFRNSLADSFEGLEENVTEENLQSRTRGALVMALANKFNLILLNTSNKSELATGYGTLYGDMAGGLGVLGDLYKLQVYALCQYINRNGEIIPQHILTKAPSAELRPGQKDSDSLPSYELLDPILYQYIERRKGPKEIIAMGFEENLVRRVLRMVNNNEYKRNQFCPIIRVSPKAFGVGRRVPIVGTYLS